MNLELTFTVTLILSLSVGCFTRKCLYKVSRGDKVYNLDMSSLDEFQYKEMDFMYQGIGYKMYLSLCKPLEDIPMMYLMKNSVKEPRMVMLNRTKHMLVPFILTTAEEMEFKSDGNDDGVRLTILSLSQCLHFSQLHLNYSVNIKFRCWMKEEEPRFEGFNVEHCLFSFEWLTPHACSLPYKPSNCSLRFNDYIFDLSTLRHPIAYDITIKDVRVQMNFCGPVNSTECQSTDWGFVSFCALYNNQTRDFTQKNLYKSSYDDKKQSITFLYVASVGDQGIFPSVVVSLVCNRDSYEVSPEVRNNRHGRRLSVSVETHLTCKSDERSSVYDGIYKYSLPAETNVRIQHGNATFLLSPRGHLKRDSFWLGGKAAAAMINGSVLSLGWMRSLSLTEGDPKTVLLVLSGGSVCPGTRRRAKSSVEFSCAQNPSGPSFLGRTEDCKFLFKWAHPSVCPVPGDESKNCFVRDPLLAYEFNLSSSRTFEVQGKDAVFKMNFCGERSEVCHSETNASVCLVRGDEETIVGRRSSQLLLFEDGGLAFHLAGEECRRGVPAQVYVNVVCDYGATDDSAPIFIGEDSDCVYNFTWNTRKACPLALGPHTVPCTAKNNEGDVVDLTPLRLSSSNYRIPKDEDSYFLINVCGTLWYGRGETCLKQSGACLVNKKEFISIGEVKEGPVFDGSQTDLVYKNKFPCSYPSNLDTTITFLCNLENEGPRYVGAQNCNHNFVWKTQHACATVKKNAAAPTPKIAAVPTPKIAAVPTPKIAAVPTPKITAVPTPKIAAVLTPKITKTQSVTIIRNPEAVDPVPSKVYATADQRSSVVYSEPQNKSAQNSVKEKSDSGAVLTYFQVPCTTPGSEIDLSVLRQGIIRLSKDITAYVNLCRAANVPNGKCFSDLSCLVFPSNKTLSLGSRFHQPVQNKNGSVTLNYYGGSTCEEDKNAKYSTVLTFSCNKSRGVGVPVLSPPVASCTYAFLWETSVVCPDDVLVFDKRNCNLFNKNTSEFVNLLPVSNRKETKLSHGVFLLNLCSEDSSEIPCKGNVCIKTGSHWVSGGYVEDIGYNYNFNQTVIYFNSGDICEGLRRYSTALRLKCSRDDQPWTFSEENCLFVMELKSPLACPSTLPQASFSSSYGITISLVVVAFSAVGFVLFKWKSRNGFRCTRKDPSYETLCLSQSRKSLLKRL